jgi:rubredoxin-NAD+ reductase
MQPLLVLGAGLAGWTTVREFRKLDTTTPVVLVTADSGDFYAKPSLSNAFAQQRSPQQLVSTPAAAMAQTLQVTLLAHTRVERIDPQARTVHTVDGKALEYGQLVLATGAQPIRAPLAGNAADQVRTVNSLEEFAGFHAALGLGETRSEGVPAPSKTILLIGAGLIGCEFANDLLQAGHQVHVVDPSARPLALLLPEGAGVQLQQALQAQGAQWHFGCTVQTLDRDAAGPFRAGLSDGTTVQADAVLSAIGLRADTALAAAAGLACGRGIVVGMQLQTSDAHIHALGDCAEYASAGARTLPYVMPIMNAAKALAATLAGTPTALTFPLMPVAIKTPALPVVVASPHPAQAGDWVAEPQDEGGLWRFVDPQGVQRGFVLTGKQTARRMELARATVL